MSSTGVGRDGRLVAPPRNAGYWGKFRGTVIDNIDPEGLARLLCEVPALPAMLLNWALPCVPYAGPEVGFFAIPPIGANVWVEFEGGDPGYPVWTGCFWELLEIPLALELSPEDPSLVKVFRSDFCTLVFNDTPVEGGITISVVDPAVDLPVTLTMNSTGVEVNVGETTIIMNPEVGITVSAAEAVVEVTPETISVDAPTIELTATDVNVTGNTSIEGVVEITGDTSVEGAVEITGDTEMTGALEVTGAVDITGAVNVTGELANEGDVNIAGALSVEGDINGLLAVTVEGDLNVLGAVTVEGDEAVLGIIEGVIVPPF